MLNNEKFKAPQDDGVAPAPITLSKHRSKQQEGNFAPLAHVDWSFGIVGAMDGSVFNHGVFDGLADIGRISNPR